jgi:quinol monooxygenase YgiN
MLQAKKESICLTFELWRQDDNGNRFLIDVFTSRVDAECRLADLMRNPHKQTYWITEKPSPA